MDNDMTKGNVFGTLLRFTGPLIISGLLQQLYYITDSMIVGNFLGESALAAVGVSSPVFNIFIFTITGLVSGFTILVSHYYGAKDYERVSKLSNTFFLFIVVLGCVVSIVGTMAKDSILVMLNTPVEVLAPGSEYLAIAFGGIPFLLLYNLCGSMLRAIGDSKTPLYAVVLSSVVNIILDLVFINSFHWGIKGVAAATVVAQIISSACLLVYVHRKYPMFRISLRKELRDVSLFLESLKLGAPRVIQSSAASVGSLLLQNIMNSFGVDVVTAITTAYKIDSLTLLPVVNISVAISIFVGQNIGANNMTRAKEGLKKGVILAIGLAAVTTLFVVLSGFTLMKAFGVSNQVAGIGLRFFRICAVFYPIFGVQSAYAGFLQGSKDVMFTSVGDIICLASRVVLSYALAARLGADVIAISEMWSWVLGASLYFVRYRRRHSGTYGSEAELVDAEDSVVVSKD